MTCSAELLSGFNSLSCLNLVAHSTGLVYIGIQSCISPNDKQLQLCKGNTLRDFPHIKQSFCDSNFELLSGCCGTGDFGLDAKLDLSWTSKICVEIMSEDKGITVP